MCSVMFTRVVKLFLFMNTNAFSLFMCYFEMHFISLFQCAIYSLNQEHTYLELDLIDKYASKWTTLECDTIRSP